MQEKNCQNCKNDFIIRPEDFIFYEKIKVPPPTFCPECRMVRRMCWRNARSLFSRICGLCKKNIISMYKDNGTPVYCTSCFNSDNWDPTQYGKEVDFSKDFFSQWKDMMIIVPRHYKYSSGNLINSEFTNYTIDNKDCYLAYSAIKNEEIFYSEYTEDSKKSFDCWNVQKVDNCSYNIDSSSNFNSHFLIESHNCVDSFFLFDCSNCFNCILSFNQRNQSYMILNKKYTKEEYTQKLNALNLGTYSGVQKVQAEFDRIIKNKAIHKYAQILQSQNVVGDQIIQSKTVYHCFDAQTSENVAYSNRVVGNVRDSWDLTGTGYNVELAYENIGGSLNGLNNRFVYITLGSQNCEYTFGMRNCRDCFGCANMNNVQYCILNKQYTKEEYFELLPKVKQHMADMPYIDSKGREFKYGEFFPMEFSPFGYNETNANYFFPISKEEAIEKGYNWYERPDREYVPTQTSETLPDSILDVSDTILGDIIACPNTGDYRTQCTKAFKIHPEELQFLRQKGLPLPRYCPNCRHYERLSYKNPMKLYTRSCSNGCGTSFASTYAPERLEKVFCETCYKRAMF